MSQKNYVIKELNLNDLKLDMLQNFNRYQEVYKCWRKEGDQWVLKDIPFTEQWDDELKREVVAVDFTRCIKSGGTVWAAFNKNNTVIAFACLYSKAFGSKNQYVQLTQLHVSYEYRNKGIGKRLLNLSAEKAKSMGAKKLYISTHSSEESQLFYRKSGCVDAEEINKEQAKLEPCDCQLEYCLE